MPTPRTGPSQVRGLAGPAGRDNGIRKCLAAASVVAACAVGSGCGCDAVAKTPAVIVIAPGPTFAPTTACIGRTCARLKRSGKVQSLSLPVDGSAKDVVLTGSTGRAGPSRTRVSTRVLMRKDKSMCDPVRRATVRFEDGQLEQDLSSDI